MWTRILIAVLLAGVGFLLALVLGITLGMGVGNLLLGP